MSYLCDLEKKLPAQDYKIYIPSHRHTVGEVTPQELNEECQRMLEFACMEGYKAKVSFTELSGDVAGNTVPGDISDGVVRINVSSGMKSNWKALIATLAHEICHQVIYRYGIRPNIGWITETYTDLCTIYIGFGELILAGYDTNDAHGRHTLGYLQWNTYQVTNHMVSVVRGGASSKNTGLEGSDIFADEAIQLWESDNDRSRIVIKEFERRSARLAAPLRKIEYMESLLDIYRGYLKPSAEKLNEAFVNARMAVCDSKNKLAAFSTVYDTYTQSLAQEQEVNDSVLEAALYNLYNDVKRQYGRVVFERKVACPCCGKKIEMKDDESGLKTIKCISCGINFVVDTTEWNPTVIQRKVELNRIGKRQKQEQELEVLRQKVHAEQSAAAWRETLRLKDELTTINAAIDSLPALLRRIVKKQIQKHSNDNK